MNKINFWMITVRETRVMQKGVHMKTLILKTTRILRTKLRKRKLAREHRVRILRLSKL